MKPAQVTPDQPLAPTDLVMAAVLVEIGMETRDDGQPASQGEPEDAQPQRRLGGDVDDVRPERIDRPMDRAERRPGEMKLLVKRENERGDRVNLLAAQAWAVVRVNQLDVVAALRQKPNQLPQRPRNPIDLGKVGFR